MWQVAAAQRQAQTDVSRAREEEGGKARRLDAERQRLQETLSAQTSAAAASAAEARDRLDASPS